MTFSKAMERWPDAAWVIGDGPWASVAHCNVTTVQLHATKTAAMYAKNRIDKGACGGHCVRDHEVVRL